MTTRDLRATLHQRVVEQLGQSIVHGTLSPGSTLPLDEIEKEFDASRTAVREALRVLTTKGLLGARPRRGTYVRPRSDWILLDSDVMRWRGSGPPDPLLLKDLTQLRELIEPQAAALAATHRTDEQLGQMYDALADISYTESSGLVRHIEADIVFHSAILDATSNELLASLKVLLGPALRMRDRVVYDATQGDPREAHALVADAIRDQNPEDAERAMNDLLDEARVTLETALIGQREAK